MSIRPPVWALALLTLAGCGMSPKKFAKEYAKGACSYFAECEPDYLEYYGGDEKECVEEYEDYYDADDYEDCEFDKKKAKECIKAIKELGKSCSFDDVDYDACNDVYDC